GNSIAFNAGNGITVLETATGNVYSANAIFANAGLGIDLGGDGVTPNDFGDADPGPNDRQNFPGLDSALATSAGTLVDGSLNSLPNTSFVVEFFANSAPDPSGFGEGERFLGSQMVTTD